MWITKKVSSFNRTTCNLNLHENNHMLNASEKELSEIYECEILDTGDKESTIEITITNWADSNTVLDEKNYPLDLNIYTTADKMYWEPVLEASIKKDFIKGSFKELSVGYLNGRKAYIGLYQNKEVSSAIKSLGYIMWVKIKK